MSGGIRRRGGSGLAKVSAHYSQDSKTHNNQADAYYNIRGATSRRCGGSGGSIPVSYTTLYQYTGYTIPGATFVRNIDTNIAGAQVIEEEAKKLIEDKSIKAFSFSNHPDTGVPSLYYHATSTLTKVDNTIMLFSYQNFKYVAPPGTMPSPGDQIYPGVEFTIPTYVKDFSLDNTTVTENVMGATVGSVTSTLSKADSAANVSYMLNNGVAHDKFLLDGSTLKVIDGEFLDYETASSHNLSITSIVDNNSFAYTTKAFTIDVNNVESEGPKTIMLSGTTIDENVSVETTIGQLSSEHYDSTAAGLGISYTIDDPSGNFLLDGILLKKKNGVSFNYEHKTGDIFDERSFDITIKATDAFGHELTKSFTITVNDTNEAPFDIILEGNTIMENSAMDTVIGTLSTSDVDQNQTHTYTIDPTTDPYSSFGINGSDLVLKSASLGANTYSLTITSADSATQPLSYTKSFDIYIQAYAAPSNISLSFNQIPENSAAGTIVGTLSATAGDSNDITFFMNNTSFFDVALADDGITYNLISTMKFDHETKHRYSVLVICRDGNNKYYSKILNIDVTNVVEGPTDITLYELTTDQPLTGNLTVNENMNSGYNLGYLNATGRDSNDLTFSIDNDNTNFMLSGSTPIFLKTNASFNYEAESSYTVTIRVTDTNQQYITKDFTVDVEDVNEAPYNLTLSSNTHTVNSPIGTAVGSLSVTDPDANDTISWSINDSDFEIAINDSNNTKEATLKNKSVIGTAQTKTVTVTATDSGSLSVSETFTIVVEPEPTYSLFTFDTGDDTPLGDVYFPKLGTNNVNYNMKWDFGGETVTSDQSEYLATDGKSHVRNISASSGTIKLFGVQATSSFNFGIRSRGWDNKFLSSSFTNYLTMVETNDDDYWGLTENLESLDNAFFNCKFLEKVPNTLPTSVKDLYQTFAYAMYEAKETDTSGDVEVDRIICNQFLEWNTENVEDFASCFHDHSNNSNNSLTNEDFKNWNISSCTTNGLSNMFRNQKKFEGKGLGDWVLPSTATYLGQMFQGCHSFNEDLSNWNVSNITSFSNMFRECENFNADISGWVTSNATSMSYMFYECYKFNQNLSGWDVSKVRNMEYMFGYNSIFNQNISGWDVSSVTNMLRMFFYSPKFDKNIRRWAVQQGCTLDSMFSGATEMNSKFGTESSPYYTEYYGNTPNIQFFNFKSPPTDIQLSGDKQVNENMNSGYVIGTLSATAGDSNVLTFLVDDTVNFIIDGTSLKTYASFDYETKSSYPITITVQDGNGESATEDFTIDVVNVNEAPHTMQLSSNTHTVNSPANTVIGTLTATDPEGDNVTFSVDNGNFKIEDSSDGTSATLMNKEVIDTAQTISITVTATEKETSDGLSVSKSFDIVVEPEPLYLLLTFDTGDTSVPLGDLHVPKIGSSNYITYTMEWDFGGETVTHNQDEYVATEGNAAGYSHVRNISSSTGTIKISGVQSNNQNIGFGHYSRGWDNNFLFASSPNYLTEVETNDDDNWGLTTNLTSLDNAFFNCKFLEKVPTKLPTSVTSLYQTFAYAMYEAKETDTSGDVAVDRIKCNQFLEWNTSQVEEFGSCFQTTTANAYLTNEDFKNWDISSCTGPGLSNMFRRQQYFIGTGLDSWKELPSAVNNLSQMFRECKSFTGESIKDWKVEHITDFSYTFRDCEAFNADISSWTPTQATSMVYMFTDCSSFDQNIRRWAVQQGCDLNGMFSGATKMNSKFGTESSPDYTEYYGNTPGIQFFNYTPPTPTTIEMLDGTVHVLSVTDGVFDPEESSDQLQGHDKESIVKLTLGSEVTAFSTKFKANNPFSNGYYTVDMSHSKIVELPASCFEGVKVQHMIFNKELEKIGNYCFKNCAALCVLTIPEDSNLNIIGFKAFEGASNFKGLYLPSKVCYDDESQQGISLNSSAFSDSSLEVVLFGSKGNNTSNASGVQTLKGKDNVDVTVDVTDFETTKITTSNGNVTNCNIVGEAGEHLNISIWTGGGSTVVHIGSLRASVTKVDLGSITSVKNYTFNFMSSLKVIDLRRANKLETISNYSLTNLASLETVHFHEETFPLLTNLGVETFKGNDKLIFDILDLSVYPNLTQISVRVFIDSAITTLKLGEGITSIDDWNHFCKPDTIETLDLSKATSLTSLSTGSKSNNPFGNQSKINKVILNKDVVTVNNYFGNSDNIQIEISKTNALNITESTKTLGNYNVTVSFNDIKVSIHIKDTSSTTSWNYLQLSEISFYDENDQQIDVLSHEKPSENLDGTPNNVGENSPDQGILQCYDKNSDTKWYTHLVGTVIFYLESVPTKYTFTLASDSGDVHRSPTKWHAQLNNGTIVQEDHTSDSKYLNLAADGGFASGARLPSDTTFFNL